MFNYYIFTYFITSNKYCNSCHNLHSVYQTYPYTCKKKNYSKDILCLRIVFSIFICHDWEFHNPIRGIKKKKNQTGNFKKEIKDLIYQKKKRNKSQISIYVHSTSTPCEYLHIQHEIENRNMRGDNQSFQS